MLPLPFSDDDSVDENKGTGAASDSEDSFFAPRLCRQLSFEGLMGGFLRKAEPKKSGLRKKQEEEHQAQEKEGRVLPERGSLGRSLSVEELLPDQDEPHKPRRGRRPERQGEAAATTEAAGKEEV